jgi:hypothetical protein
MCSEADYIQSAVYGKKKQVEVLLQNYILKIQISSVAVDESQLGTIRPKSE